MNLQYLFEILLLEIRILINNFKLKIHEETKNIFIVGTL